MPSPPTSLDAESSDPEFLRAHSQFKSYTINHFTYTNLRIFHHAHPTTSPRPSSNTAPAPLIVCIHGLGGSVAQFAPLLPHLTALAPVLAIDLPGCGRSAFAESSWDAYAPSALELLLDVVIADFRAERQPLVLVGHSMGSALAARLASRRVQLQADRQITKQADTHAPAAAPHVAALIALCPITLPISAHKAVQLRRLLWVPGWLFDLWRMWDRRGGTESASVRRFVSGSSSSGNDAPEASEELKAMQHTFNAQSRTPVWRRMAWGLLPADAHENGESRGGLVGLDIWAGVRASVLLVGGEDDHVTLPGEVNRAADAVRGGDASGSQVVRTKILPCPANHTLLYDPRTVPEVVATINTFLGKQFSGVQIDKWL
ncbi:hypothetical protein BROUX41_005105 [Berkeleyomyces rouxiae]|uniref:uncharacterized protein n=1 Tax=Berkeleyomyces rouxiae TaxID=2035830 RepID=UPI003B81A6BA